MGLDFLRGEGSRGIDDRTLQATGVLLFAESGNLLGVVFRNGATPLYKEQQAKLVAGAQSKRLDDFVLGSGEREFGVQLPGERQMTAPAPIGQQGWQR